MDMDEQLRLRYRDAAMRQAEMLIAKESAENKFIELSDRPKFCFGEPYNIPVLHGIVGGSFVGLLGSFALRSSAVERYFAKPENTDMTSSLMANFGADTVGELCDYLLNFDNEFAYELFEASGAREYFFDFLLGLSATGAVLGGLACWVLALRGYLHDKKVDANLRDWEFYAREYNRANQECEELSALIERNAKSQGQEQGVRTEIDSSDALQDEAEPLDQQGEAQR